jgi:hypothetical protein
VNISSGNLKRSKFLVYLITLINFSYTGNNGISTLCGSGVYGLEAT